VAINIVLFLFTYFFAGVDKVAVVFRFKESTALASVVIFILNISLTLFNSFSYIIKSSDIYVILIYFF
jgi:uncharacterized membrane protein YqaE (UPF0057 family)